jgi:hypothetical protein
MKSQPGLLAWSLLCSPAAGAAEPWTLALLQLERQTTVK